jgi:fructose/tagatose bisphosphate aldolase
MQYNIVRRTGDQVQEISNYVKEKGFVLPAVNVTGSNTINSSEISCKFNAPVIIQFSNGGACSFIAGKDFRINEKQQSVGGNCWKKRTYPRFGGGIWSNCYIAH